MYSENFGFGLGGFCYWGDLFKWGEVIIEILKAPAQYALKPNASPSPPDIQLWQELVSQQGLSVSQLEKSIFGGKRQVMHVRQL